jgi:hypothetical protein
MGSKLGLLLFENDNEDRYDYVPQLAKLSDIGRTNKC